MAHLVFAGEIVKALAARRMDCAVAGEALPAADRSVDVERVEFHTVADAADAFRGAKRRAAAEKGIEHDVAAGRAIHDRVGDEGHRFYRWVQRQEIALRFAPTKIADAGIVPNVGSVSAILPELHIVPVRRGTRFEDQDQLVL